MRPFVIEIKHPEFPVPFSVVWPSPETLASGISQEEFERIALEDRAGLIVEKVNCKPSDLPPHPWAEKAWKRQGDAVVVDMVKAKAIAHDKRRTRREKLMEPLDKLATSPNNSIKGKAMTDKQAVLDADAPVQVAIDAATTPEQLKQILANYQAI